MKKPLLLLAAGMAVMTVQADALESPHIFPNTTAQRVSPDGRYFVSEPGEGMEIFDLMTGESWMYINETVDDEDANYNSGHGNCWSGTGIMVGTTHLDMVPQYWKNGEWFDLDRGNSMGMFMPSGITPDGTRICGNGNISREGYSTETMQLPVYWDAEGDGFGELHTLPCPALDFTNRAPQHITAISISDDGKTIFGQIIDYTGQYPEPIVYTQSADGEWSYSLPLEKLFRPEGFIFPEYPDEIGIEMPVLEDFMTQNEIDAYNAALDNWYNEAAATGNYDWASYPEMEQFATPEEIESYNIAADEYNRVAMEFNDKISAFFEAIDTVMANAPTIVKNLGLITPDGKDALFTVMTEIENPDPMSWFPFLDVNYPCRLTLSDGNMKVYDDVPDATVWSVLADGSFTAGNMSSLWDPQPMMGYIERNGVLVPLFDYMQTANPDNAGWMEEYMTHDCISVEFDEDWNYIEIVEEKLVTGVPVASRDLNVIVTWTLNVWDMESEDFCYAYYFNMGKPVSVDALRDRAVSSYEVYNLNGVSVMKTTDKSEIKNLDGGIYIVKATGANGVASVSKVAI